MSLPPSKPRSAAQPVAGDDHTDVTSVPAPPWDGDEFPQDADDTNLLLDPEGTKQTGIAIRSAAPVPTPTHKRATMPGRDDPDLEPGTRLGEYRIQAKIGQGGMGVVYSAIHPLIGKGAAIKILKKELCADPHQLERFIDEARVVNQIGHPNIVDVFAFGEMPDGRSYLVMEWLKGETLRARIARSTMDAAEVNAIVRPLARALEAAHEKGVIHRDLKPDNVFLVPVRGEVPTVKLLDFGIAKLASNEHRVEKTATGAIVGTPQYIAPEQAKGYAIDHRADIYALGGIVYELLTGRPPFIADNAMEMVAKHLMETPLPPSHFAPSVAPELDALVLRMLAKTPDGRPSLTEVCEVIERAKTRASTQTSFPGVNGTPISGVAKPSFFEAVPPSTLFLDELGAGPLAAENVRSNTSQPLTADASSPVERVSVESSALSTAPTAPGATSRSAVPARISQPVMEEPVRRRMPLWIAILGVPLAGLAAFVVVSATGGGGGKAPSTAANTRTATAAIESTTSAGPTAAPGAAATPSSTTNGSIARPPVATPAVTSVRPTPVAKVQLRLVISGARAPDIFIDGKRSSAEVKLRPGLHEIEVRAPRMQTQKLHVDVAPNGTTTKRIALRPKAEAPKKADPPRKPEPAKVDPPKKPNDDSELLSPGSLNNAPSRR